MWWKSICRKRLKTSTHNTRLIIAATEFEIECSSSLVSQCSTFSLYKNKNTVKVLISIIQGGAIFLYPLLMKVQFHIKKLVKFSGLLEKLEVGDEIKGSISKIYLLHMG